MADTPATPTGAQEPTAAEQLLTIVAAAGSLTLSGPGFRRELVGTGLLDDAGRFTLRMAERSPVAVKMAASPDRTLPVVAEFTDVAPVAVRNRIRARVRIWGRLTPAAEPTTPAFPAGSFPDPGAAGLTARIRPARATITTAAGCHAVTLTDLRTARPDPLACGEAGFLMHLADRHPEAVARLARLAEPRLLQGVVSVRPLALDRLGIVLRLEHARTHHDVRVPFDSPVREPSEVTDRVRALLGQARCPRRHRPHARP